jgi:hypothetical protein
MKSNPLFRALLALAVITTSSVDAQDEADSVSLRIDFVSWSEDIEDLRISSGAREQAATALAFRYSEPVDYRGPRILELSQSPGGGDAFQDPGGTGERKRQFRETGLPLPEVPAAPAAVDGQQIPAAILAARKRNPEVVALISLPANSRRITVLLAPGPGGIFLSQIIDDDPSRLPPGKVRIHNLSPHLIAMRLPAQPPRQLKQRESFLADSQDGTLTYELAYQLDGEWEIQENNLVSIEGSEQVQMVILQSTASFFTAADGSRSGFLQTVLLRRQP